tara:strand:+ start:424 stop:969 length:546 start_codon:yes stop_codon:yes gene_type:complete
MSVNIKALKQLLWIGIGSICMFFGGLTSAYIVRKAEGNWTLFEIPDPFLYSTFVIITSSIVLILSKKRLKQEASPFKIILTVFILGIIFTLLQIKGWKELTDQGVFLTGEGSNASGSFLYILTLAHLVHLVGGLIALLFTSINAAKGKYSIENSLGLDLTSIYWHFLGILWLYLFFFLKYI